MKLSTLLADLPLEGVEVRTFALADPDIRHVVEDSRRVQPGDLFVARSGTRQRGEDFIQDALGRGAAAVLVVAPMPAATVSSKSRLRPGEILGKLAHRIHGGPARDMAIFAVTGTNGKTTISYLVRAICQAAGRRCGLISTVEIDDGATTQASTVTTPGPLELAELFARMVAHGATCVSMEASSHALDQDRLAGFTVAAAMFSNLTGDHLDYHRTMEEYAAAKARLFSCLPSKSCAIINADDPWSQRMVQDSQARVIRYGLQGPVDFHAEILRLDACGMDLRIGHPGGSPWHVTTGLVGRHNAQNILCAVAACAAQGIDPAAIQAGLQQMHSVPGRLQPVLVAGRSRVDLPFQVLVDYAHTHDALENVLHAIRPWTAGRLICVFGCGGDRDATKRPKMAAVAERLADQIIVTSDNPRTEDPDQIIAMIVAGFADRSRVVVCSDRRSAIHTAIELARPGDVVLIAGKGHENYQIIGTVKQHFDDLEEARAALTLRCGAAIHGATAALRAAVPAAAGTVSTARHRGKSSIGGSLE